MLEQFGGHKYAAGLTLKTENIPALQQRFEEVVAQTIPEELLIQEIRIDAELNLEQIDSKFFRILSQFGPFGPQNMAPVFVSKNVKVAGKATLVGNNHIKINVYQGQSAIFDCIGFGLGQYVPLINNGYPFDICYSIEENVWKEKRSIQLSVKGIRSVV